jgi:hypothetical protein
VTDLRREQGRGREQDEIDETLEPGPEDAAPDEVEQQDFAARNVMMSNALPGGASPAAGAVVGSGGDLGMEPETDQETPEERVAERTE